MSSKADRGGLDPPRSSSGTIRPSWRATSKLRADATVVDWVDSERLNKIAKNNSKCLSGSKQKKKT